MRLMRNMLACACAAIVLTGCESTEEATTQSASLGVLNETCPISGEAVDGSVTADYEGAKIGLCCAGCTSKWEDMSDDAKAEFVASQGN